MGKQEFKIEEISCGISELDNVQKLISDIKLKKLETSQEVALRTADILEDLLQSSSWANAKELLDVIKDKIRRFSQDLPHDVIPANILRHFLKVVREEYEAICQEKPEHPPHQIFTAKLSDMLRYSEQSSVLKTNLLNHFKEYKEELVSSTESIANQASELIYEKEVILTMGKSKTVEQFLINAKNKNPKIIIVNNPSVPDATDLAEKLAEHDFDVTLIYETNIYSFMSRVNKVVLGANAIMGLTEMKVPCGIFTVSLAANNFSVPVMVLAQTYKYSPLPHKDDDFEMGDLEAVLPKSTGLTEHCEVLNYLYDYVPLKMVNMIINQQGRIDPSYISMLHSDMYNSDDYDI